MASLTGLNYLGRFSGTSKLLYSLIRPKITNTGNIISEDHEEIPKAFFTPHPTDVIPNSLCYHWQMAARIVHTARMFICPGFDLSWVMLWSWRISSRDCAAVKVIPSMPLGAQTHSLSLHRKPTVLARPAHKLIAARVFVGPTAHCQRLQ
jgi:hypothetical protein